MRIATRRWVWIAACFSLVSGFALAQDRTEEIIAVEARWATAMRSGDVAALDRLFSDDLVYTHSTGSVMTKREALRTFASGSDLRAIEYTDRKVKLLGSAAVVTAEVRFIGGSGGTSYNNRTRLTHVWAKAGSDWQLVVQQTTFIR